MADPKPGTYQHYEGDLFEVLGMAQDAEDEDRQTVIYSSLGIAEDFAADLDEGGSRIVTAGTRGELFIASVEWFTEEMNGGKLRFRLVSSERGR